MRRRSHPFAFASAVTLAAALLAGGCSSDKTSDGASPGTPEKPAGATTLPEGWSTSPAPMNTEPSSGPGTMTITVGDDAHAYDEALCDVNEQPEDFRISTDGDEVVAEAQFGTFANEVHWGLPLEAGEKYYIAKNVTPTYDGTKLTATLTFDVWEGGANPLADPPTSQIKGALQADCPGE